MTEQSLEEEIAGRIRRRGPLPFGEVMEAALYDPTRGFYATGGHAGRRGDFITSPEVGPLFGTLIGRHLDRVWDALGQPDPFVVIEAGAGVGTLARTVLDGAPRCLPATTYVLVEQSATLRERHAAHLEIEEPAFAFAPRTEETDDGDLIAPAGTGPRFVSLAELPAGTHTGVILANELLDNLPFDLYGWTSGEWHEVRVGLDEDDDRLVEFTMPAEPAVSEVVARLVDDADLPDGARLPLQHAAQEWVRDALGRLDRGRLLVIDYADATPSLARRPASEWLRTYRGHERGVHPLEQLGAQDITVEVAPDQLALVATPDDNVTQASFLTALGIEELVDEGRRIWNERAHLGDLAAIKARSRVREAEALLDAAGLGAFRVLEWRV